MAALGLRCCVHGLSLVAASGGSLLIAVRGPLIAVVSLLLRSTGFRIRA